MAEQREGKIINIASVAGVVPLKLQCAYNAAKAGVINLTKAMAGELGASGVPLAAMVGFHSGVGGCTAADFKNITGRVLVCPTYR